jgi:hypothetical protein
MALESFIKISFIKLQFTVELDIIWFVIRTKASPMDFLSEGFTHGYSYTALSGLSHSLCGFHSRVFIFNPFRAMIHSFILPVGFTHGYSYNALSGLLSMKSLIS